MRSPGTETVEPSRAARPERAAERPTARAAGRMRLLTDHGALALTLLAAAGFAGLCLYHYQLPGLYYDEAQDAVPAMQLLLGQPVALARGVGIHLFGRAFPVMIGDYWGVISTYAVLPLFWLLGVGVLPIRLWPIGAGVAAVLLTFLVGRRLYGEPAGLVAALLLAIFPSFIFWSRIGIYVIAHIVAITLGIVYCYLRWRQRGARGALFAAALLTGIGLSTKLLFLWFLIAVPAAYVALLAADWLAGELRAPDGTLRGIVRRLRADLPLRWPLDPALALLGFLIGAFPVLYYNLVSRGSYLVLRANLFQTERGVDNFALGKNLRVEAVAVRTLLEGSFFWFYGAVYGNPLYPWLTGVSSLGLLALVHVAPELRRYRRPTVFLLAFAGAIYLLSCFTVSILGPTHLLILLPIPQLMLAACAVHGTRAALRRIGRRPLAREATVAVAVLALVALAGRDLWVDVRYHQALARSGGVTAFSSEIYPLAAQLDREGVRHPYALDWGMKYNVMILTAGRVTPLEIYGATYEPGPDFEGAVRQALREPDPVFISTAEDAQAFLRLDDFRRLVAESGRQLVVERKLTEPSGRPVYYIFRVR